MSKGRPRKRLKTSPPQNDPQYLSAPINTSSPQPIVPSGSPTQQYSVGNPVYRHDMNMEQYFIKSGNDWILNIYKFPLESIIGSLFPWFSGQPSNDGLPTMVDCSVNMFTFNLLKAAKLIGIWMGYYYPNGVNSATKNIISTLFTSKFNIEETYQRFKEEHPKKLKHKSVIEFFALKISHQVRNKNTNRQLLKPNVSLKRKSFLQMNKS